jgi:L-erythro-3,5-diaminohexanoate dehydrogenase
MGAVIEQTWAPIAAELGILRALDPPGALPHIARTLDAQTAATDWEAEIDVEVLSVDATSYDTIRSRCGADPRLMEAMIAEIVSEHGKLQNPWTGSGGVLMGRVLKVGRNYRPAGLRPGELVMPVASLIAVPLRLDSVGPLTPASSQVPVRGRAIVTGRMLCAPVPSDLPPSVALAAFDVYPAASHVREMAAPNTHLLILGAGHAGLLAVAAAREAVGAGGRVTALDRSPSALERALAVDSSASVIEADVTDPVALSAALSERGLPPSDLTLLCTTVPGAEGAALVATADTGTILFFSTATTFAAAGLGADALGSRARLVIPNGLTRDQGEYAFELLRRVPELRRAFEAQA